MPAGPYIVSLIDEPAASYEGTVSGYVATTSSIKTRSGAATGASFDGNSKASIRYEKYLATKQRAIAASVSATIGYSYTVASNGFSALLTSYQATALSKDRRVQSLVPDGYESVEASTPASTFLKLDGPAGIWRSTLTLNTGAGTVVGIIDTGIALENPSFSGEKMSRSSDIGEVGVPTLSKYFVTPVRDQIPYSGTGLVSMRMAANSDGRTERIFKAPCQSRWSPIEKCNSKVLTLQDFPDNPYVGPSGMVDATGSAGWAQDESGHGTTVAQIAAGNANVNTGVPAGQPRLISGVAPDAKIAVYKACDELELKVSCVHSNVIAAIDAAVRNNVDVINCSFGKTSAAAKDESKVSEALKRAVEAGIVVVAAAGNLTTKTLNSSTVTNVAPWLITVASSNLPDDSPAVLTLTDPLHFGGRVTYPFNGYASSEMPLTNAMLSSSIPAGARKVDKDAATTCTTNSLKRIPQVKTVIICTEGGITSNANKAREVDRAGGAGMVLIPTLTDLQAVLPNPAVPTFTLASPSGLELKIKNLQTVETVQVSWASGASLNQAINPAPVVAPDSGRGPSLEDGNDFLKPDITAPGVGILSADLNKDSRTPGFAEHSGTSMAAPQIAGLALLYLQIHPTATPAAVKSALMTGAVNTKIDAQTDQTDPFVQGSGEVNPLDLWQKGPGLVYNIDAKDWNDLQMASPASRQKLNLPSISIGAITAPTTVKRTVTAVNPGLYLATVSPMPGYSVTVFPSGLVMKSGSTASFTVTFTPDPDVVATGVFVRGNLTWSGTTSNGIVRVRSPLAVRSYAVSRNSPLSIQPPLTAITTALAISGKNGAISPSFSGNTLLVEPANRFPVVNDFTRLLTIPTQRSSDDTTESHTIVVPSPVAYAQFNLATTTMNTAMTLTVGLLNADGSPNVGPRNPDGSPDRNLQNLSVWNSATTSDTTAPAQVAFRNLPAGTYQVSVTTRYTGPSLSFNTHPPTASSVLTYALVSNASNPGMQVTTIQQPNSGANSLNTTAYQLTWSPPAYTSSGLYLSFISHAQNSSIYDRVLETTIPEVTNPRSCPIQPSSSTCPGP